MAVSGNVPHDEGAKWFQAELVRAQPALFAYARTLMAGSPNAWDVLQNANKVMCEKEAAVSSPTEFLPWAYTVVRYEVMAYRSRMARDRHLFSLAVLERLAAQAAVEGPELDQRVRALEGCLEKLPERQRTCVDLRYCEGLTLREMSGRLERTENAVAAILYRARISLAKCIETAMLEGGEP